MTPQTLVSRGLSPFAKVLKVKVVFLLSFSHYSPHNWLDPCAGLPCALEQADFEYPANFDVYVFVLSSNSATKRIFHVCVFVPVTIEIPAKRAGYVHQILNRWCSELLTNAYVY